MEKLPILRLHTYKTKEIIVVPKKKEIIVQPKIKEKPKVIKEANNQPKEKLVKKTGIVSWYKKDKGYGFIKPDDNSKEVFFHYKELKKINLETIESETKIRFTTKEENNRIQACNIKVLEIPKLVNIRNTAVKVLNVLNEKYPKTFPYKPLAIGIKDELFAVSEELGFSKTELRIFLRFYCSSREYRTNLILNAERVNLKGEVSGVVKEEELNKSRTIN